LAAGRVVVCDRFFDATLVYQGYSRGLDKALIRSLHRLVCDDLQPDATLLFDLAPNVGLARAWREIDSGGRTRQETRFENETLAFHQKVRDGYLDLARRDPQRYRLIDANGDAKQVSRAVQEALTMLLPERR